MNGEMGPIIFVPVLVLYGALVAYQATFGRHTWIRQARIRTGCCPECGYDLSMSPSGCPECANVPNATELARVFARPKRSFLRFLLLPLPPFQVRPPTWERYTKMARKVLGLAQAVAETAGDTDLLLRHLLAAMAVEPKCLGGILLANLGFDLNTLSERLAPGITNKTPIRVTPYMMWRSEAFLRSAVAEANLILDEHIGTEHFLLAFLTNPSLIEDEAFRQSGVSHRSTLIKLLITRVHWRYDIGKLDEALSLSNILLCEPTATALNLKAWILAVVPEQRFHRPAEALELARRACELTGYKQAASLDTLAVCNAANGNFAEAIKFSRKAIEIAPPGKAQDCRERLAMFERGEVFQESPRLMPNMHCSPHL